MKRNCTNWKCSIILQSVTFFTSYNALLATWLGATHFLAHVQHTSKPLPFASHVLKVSEKEKSAIHLGTNLEGETTDRWSLHNFHVITSHLSIRIIDTFPKYYAIKAGTSKD